MIRWMCWFTLKEKNKKYRASRTARFFESIYNLDTLF